MSTTSDASTLPLRDTPVGGPRGETRPGLSGGRVGAWVGGVRRETAVGALALAVLVGCSALVVVIAANRPSFLSATSHAYYFPHWMAGPLGGLWPWFPRSNNTLRYLLTLSIVAMYGCYLLALTRAPRLPARWVIAAIVAVHAIFLLSPPLALTDVFNYVNYGRMEVVHHLNPYTTIPILEPHGDPSFDLSNWHHLLSPYGPLFTLITFAVVPLGVAASFWALKGMLVVASLLTVALVWRCARLLGRDPVQAIVFVGLNPIVLVWGLGGDHNDFLMMVFVLLGFYLLLRGRGAERGVDGTDAVGDVPAGAAARPAGESAGLAERVRGWLWPPGPLEIGAGTAFVTATAIKASAGILIPVVLASLIKTPRRLVQMLAGMVLAGVVVGVASLIAFGLHLPDLSTQGSLVTNVSIPNLLGLALGQGGETKVMRELLSGVLVASLALCCVYAWRRRDAVTATGWATVALLVTLSWVLPWYVLWVLPMAALSRSRRLRVTALALGAYLIVAWVPVTASVLGAVGLHPERTALGRQHQREVKELLN